MADTSLATTLARALVPRRQKGLTPVDSRAGWWPVITESFAGAFQFDETVTVPDALGSWVQFRCISLISSDIAKCRLKLVEQDANDIWTEIESAAFSPVIRKPNHFQNRIQFYSNWMESKLSRGNTYILKVRDDREVVTALYVLDPLRTRPMVADDGSVFYECSKDNLSGLEGGVDGGKLLIPSSEIIHDRWNTLYHPLVGLSPIYANGIIALMGTRIQNNSARFFLNGARPSGVLTAPGSITDVTAARVKAYWEENFTGAKAGKVAVLGDGLKYEQMTMSAIDAQVIDQLKWGDAAIAGSYGVPAHKINAAQAPANANVEALDQQYYSQCLQIHVESIEICLDEGLGLTEMKGKTYGTEFDLDDLLRMDSKTMAETIEKLKIVETVNEGRKRVNRRPIKGGDTVFRQQQEYSVEALGKRDAKEDPFATGSSSNGAGRQSTADNDNTSTPTDEQMNAMAFDLCLVKEASGARYVRPN